MKLLLDTQSFLWFIMGNPTISKNVQELIEDINNEKLLSTANLREMAIKMSLGKLNLARPFDVLIPQQLELNGIGVLNIEVSHIAVVSTMPFHHRDPFDRLLIAQCIVEQLPILSSDPVFDKYTIERFW